MPTKNNKKRKRQAEEEEIYNLFLDNINKEIDNTIQEVMELKGLTASRVIEDYTLQIKKALLVSRNEI